MLVGLRGLGLLLLILVGLQALQSHQHQRQKALVLLTHLQESVLLQIHKPQVQDPLILHVLHPSASDGFALQGLVHRP